MISHLYYVYAYTFVQERIMGHWNSNPFTMDSSYGSRSAYDAGGGLSEYSPAEWLLPYWMLRFYGLLE
jgi:hypothetical protein